MPQLELNRTSGHSPEIKSATVAETDDHRGSGKPQIQIIPGTRKRPSVGVLSRKDGSVLRLSID